MAENLGGPLAFVHIPKTAGITVNRILRNSFGIKHLDVQAWSSFTATVTASDIRRLNRIYPSPSSVAGHHVTVYSDLESVFPDIRYFTFLREPLARSASFYQFAVQTKGYRKSFEEFAERENQRDGQVKRIAGVSDVGRAIELLERQFEFVGLTERFDESMVMMRRVFSEARLDVRYRSANVASDNSIKNELLENPDKVAILESINEEDLKLYRHVTEVLFPRYQETYGPDLAGDVRRFQSENEGSNWGLKYYANLAWRNILYKPWLEIHRRRTRRAH